MERTQLLLVLVAVVTAVAAVLVWVPMVIAVEYFGVFEASLWECFDRITIVIPLLAAIVAVSPLKMKSWWAWRIPMIAGMFSLVAAIGMTVETAIFLSRNWHSFGFHPIGISLVMVMGLLLVAIGLVSRRMIHLRISVAEGRCLKCGYDLRATPARCPECGAVPPVGLLSARMG